VLKASETLGQGAKMQALITAGLKELARELTR